MSTEGDAHAEVPAAAPSHAPPRLGVGDVALLAVASALVAALGNTLAVLVTLHVLRRPSGASPEFAFLSPVAYLVIFAAIAVPLVVVAKLLPARVASRLVVGTFATVAAFALASLIPRVHAAAVFLLALGAGVRIAASLGGGAAPAPAARRRVARVAGLAAVALLAVMAGTVGIRQLQSWRLAGARGAAAEGAPNVILLILDTVRARNLSVYGYARRTTPTLERLAATGVAFDHAFSTASWSAPSHASMVTGLRGSQTRADYRSKMTGSAPTLPEALNAHGYETGGFVANYVYAGRNIGVARGFSHFEDFPFSFEQAMLSSTLTQSRSGRRLLRGALSGNPGPMIGAIRSPDFRFETYIESRRTTPEIIHNFWRWREGVGDRPYFAMLNFLDAHDPYHPPEQFRTMFGDGSRDLDRYDGAIAYLDSLVGGIVARLRERGELERTVVIVTADHGELFGEHGIVGHVGSIYPRVMHVPLVLSGGSLPKGTRVAPEVSLRDLAATVLDLAGARDRPLPGASLRRAWESGSNRGVSPVIVETTQGINVTPPNLTIAGPIKGAVDSTWYYIRYGDDREELFRWRTDTLEANNLVATADGRAAADRLFRSIRVALAPDSVSPSRSAAGAPSRVPSRAPAAAPLAAAGR